MQSLSKMTGKIEQASAFFLTLPSATFSYALYGSEAMSYYQAAEILTEVTGKRISYVDTSEEDSRNGMKQLGIPDMVIDAITDVSEVSRTGYYSTITSTVEEILGRKPISFKQFVKDNVSAFLS
jgi:uncharacterized protein YbjT (DUF2867 family)